MRKRIPFVVTSHDRLGQSGRAAGFHYEELATPYRRFTENGAEVELASPAGGAPPHDPNSLEALSDTPADVRRFLDDAEAMARLRNSRHIADVDSAAFDAVYFPGGHGAVFDLPDDQAPAAKPGRFFDSGKVVGAVCHGPGGLLSARRADGEPIVAGRRVNAFTNDEEQAVELTDTVPLLLEDRLRELGGRYECAANFEAFAVRDGNLVTGQNPSSAGRVADLMLQAMAA